MKVPKGEKIAFSVNGEVIVLDINREFSYEEGIDMLPKQLAYLVSLKGRLFKLLKERELEKDKYYASQFMVLKEDPLENNPRSNEWVRSEIMEDEHYIELLELYNQTLVSYNLISDVVKSYEIKIGVGRTLMANSRKEKDIFI